MAKNYTEELAEWIKEQSRKGRGKKLAAFHAVADDVRAALDAGYSARTIWANMHEKGRIDFRYETFLRYVNRLIKNEGAPRPGVQSAGTLVAAAPPAPFPPASTTKTPAAGPASPKPKTGMKTFTFNPVPSNREEK